MNIVFNIIAYKKIKPTSNKSYTLEKLFDMSGLLSSLVYWTATKTRVQYYLWTYSYGSKDLFLTNIAPYRRLLRSSLVCV